MKTTTKTCYNCGKQMHTATQYCWHDDFLGGFAIDCQPEEYSYCDCGEEQLAYSLCLRIEQEEQNRISQAIMNMAQNNLERLDELVATSRELKSIMNVSRQAINKNGKLKTLVYHITFKGKIYYLKKSVKLFKETGDGRFDLSPYVNETTATTMDKSSMDDVTCVEISSSMNDLTPVSANYPIHSSFGYYRKISNKLFSFQSGLSAVQNSLNQTQSHTDLNAPDAMVYNTDLSLIDSLNHIFTKTRYINSLIEIGDK